jgi:hypothetical protein
MPSPFDFDAFAQTAISIPMDEFDWKSLPDKTECLGQVVGITGENMDEYIQRDPTKWRNPNMVKFILDWELRDPQLLEEMGMAKMVVRQQLLVELSAPPPPQGNGVVLWGQNVNQPLKDLIKATRLHTSKKFGIQMLNHQMGWLQLRNRRPEGFERDITEVAYVRDPETGRASWEARQAKLNGAGS